MARGKVSSRQMMKMKGTSFLRYGLCSFSRVFFVIVVAQVEMIYWVTSFDGLAHSTAGTSTGVRRQRKGT